MNWCSKGHTAADSQQGKAGQNALHRSACSRYRRSVEDFACYGVTVQLLGSCRPVSSSSRYVLEC